MLRPFTHFPFPGLLFVLLSRALLAAATCPCSNVAGKAFVEAADALACLKLFPFNETLRQNVLSVVSGVFDFYTFEDYYLNSPAPFQESTTDIRAQIQRINTTQYATDYDFNRDLWDFTTQLNDGHTRWIPYCYISYNNLLPAPIVLLDEGVFIVPNLVELVNNAGPDFTAILIAKGFNWTRIAGAKVIEIDGLPVLEYIDKIARTVSGNYLDHNIRVNSVVGSYAVSGANIIQTLGVHASEMFPKQTSLDFLVIPVGSNSGEPELVSVPWVAAFVGEDFTDGSSYWANNCAATNMTNGVDMFSVDGLSGTRSGLTRAALVDSAIHPNTAIDLSDTLSSTLKPTDQATASSTSTIKSYILPGNMTGVMFVGSFEDDYNQTQVDVEAAVKQFLASGVKNLLIDVTNNGGGYVCLGLFLHQYLAGTKFGFPGFQTTSRANPLAQKIVEANIAQGLPPDASYYSSELWLFPNGTQMPMYYNYNNPSVPFVINNRDQPTSQRFLDQCPAPAVAIPSTPPFDLNNVAIIGNGNCASTCALFTTVMFERHGTKIATFGGHQDQSMEFKGCAGAQVLDWVNLDTEIKSAGLKHDPLAPPDLLVNGNMYHNWRSAYSWSNLDVPIAYLSEPAKYRFPYTNETYNNPTKLWAFAEESLFGGK